MEVEFPTDIDPILNESVYKLAIDDFIVLTDKQEVSEICLRVLTAGPAIVENQDHFPLGVLDHPEAAKLVGNEGPIWQYLEALGHIALAPPETEVLAMMYAVHELGSVPWVALRGVNKGYSGLLSPTSIFHIFRRYFKTRPEESKAYWNGARTNLILTRSSVIDPVLPNPNPGNPNCYCCPDWLDGQKPHRLERKQIKKAYFCPFHPSQPVAQSIGCADC